MHAATAAALCPAASSSSANHRLIIRNAAAQPKKGFGDPTKKRNAEKRNANGNTQKKWVDQRGESDRSRPIPFKEDSKELRTFLRAVEKEGSSQQQRLQIDPKVVTAKGKLDFVRVESWGEAKDPNDFETLQLKSFSPSYSSIDKDIPFYEQLVRRLQLLDSKGDISVVQVRELPPFDRWSFTEQCYLQFLADQLAVHEVLKDVYTDGLTSNESCETFGLVDLERSKSLISDITSISKEVASTSGLLYDVPKASTQTLAYARYLYRLRKLAHHSSKVSREAWLHLVAHLFVVHVSHLTTGMRIGSKAARCLPLLVRAKALSFYRDYPLEVKDPLKTLISIFNKLGSQITQDDELETVMEELPKAMQKTSLLYSMLAVEAE